MVCIIAITTIILIIIFHSVTLSINEVNITNSSSSEDFATLVHCFSKFSENVAIGLVIVIESELIAENKKQNIATCSSVTTMTMIPHSKIICEEVNNVTVSYKVSVYVASFQHESLSENCLLTTQKFVRELSRCQPGYIYTYSCQIKIDLALFPYRRKNYNKSCSSACHNSCYTESSGDHNNGIYNYILL